MSELVESLNVAVAGGLVMHALKMQTAALSS
jgi:tRNA G18 (ribose-2'-O)-methylase SpoU